MTKRPHEFRSLDEPAVYFGFGFLLAALLIVGVRLIVRSRFARLAAQRLDTVAPRLMADIESDMGELHGQIAMATRRLGLSVEQIKARTAALQGLAARELALHEQLRRTEAELAVKSGALTEVEHKLVAGKAELDDLMAFLNARDVQ